MALQPDVRCTPERQERRDSRQNRELLLRVAKLLFAEQGVAATSMTEIAEAAGVGKGTLYRHFAHKGELCSTLLREDVAAFQERLGPHISDEGADASPLAQLDMLISEKVLMTETHLALFAAVEEEAGGSGRARPFRGQFGVWAHAHIVRLLSTAIARGDISPLDVELTADTILAAVSPPLYGYQRHERGYSIERILTGIRRLFIDGLR